MMNKGVDLSVDLGKLKLKNPVMPSSGTFGYGIEFTDFLNLHDLGAIVVKGTTLHPRLGNFQRRFTEIAGLLKSAPSDFKTWAWKDSSKISCRFFGNSRLPSL